jgi:hypothetical protein
MQNILGFRQYLKSPNSYNDLIRIINNRDRYFPAKEGFITIIALCGDNPRFFLDQNDLMDKVAFYDFSAWEESAKRVAEVYRKSQYNTDKVQVIHYNESPLGLTYPLEMLVQIANLLKSDHLAVCDSDFQFPYGEVRRAYDYHLSVAKADDKIITFPRRSRRSLDAQKYPINRWAMEDLENLYIYLLSDLKVLDNKPDFQSGLSITSKESNRELNFENVGSWIGNLHMAIQVIRHKGRLEKDFIINTNPQNESTINFDMQCAKIEQLYKYYLIPLSNIIHLAVEHPDRYLMEDWTKDIGPEEIRTAIYKIEEMYNRYMQEKE